MNYQLLELTKRLREQANENNILSVKQALIILSRYIKLSSKSNQQFRGEFAKIIYKLLLKEMLKEGYLIRVNKRHLKINIKET